VNGKTTIAAIGSLAILFFIPTSKAQGCSCRPISPCAALGSAKAVFVGRVMEGTEKNIEKGSNGPPGTYEAGDVRFEIEEAFKGVAGREVTVFIETMKNTSCEWPGYKQGERLLVFAYEYKGKLVIGPCNPSKEILPPRSDDEKSRAMRKRLYQKHGLWDAEDGLRFLRSRPQNGGTLSVRVKLERREEPVTGIPFVVTGQDDQRHRAVSNEDGECEFTGLKPGKYTVNAEWPRGYTGYHDQEVDVSERSCAEVEVFSYFSGLIGGRIVDKHDQPAPFVEVHASSANPRPNKIHRSTTSDKDGKFEIIDLPAGEYYLHFESESNDKPKYYYPGGADEKKAEVITLGTGETNEGLEFKLPATFETQVVNGRVVWPDGKLAAKVTVYLRCAEWLQSRDIQIKLDVPKAQTDEQGAFVIRGFKGVSYRIEAYARIGDQNVVSAKNEVYSPSLLLTLDDDAVDVTLTLSQPGYSSNCDEEKKRRNQN
jgi:Carboxypeptidase regulatory-like domain/Prealbumin-like fold domain